MSNVIVQEAHPTKAPSNETLVNETPLVSPNPAAQEAIAAATVEPENAPEEPQDNTQYTNPEIIRRTPAEAAEEVLTPPASAAHHEAPATRPIQPSFPPGVVKRVIENGSITEYMEQGNSDLPIARSVDEEYEGRVQDTSVNYTGTTEDVPEGEVVEKNG
jgi:hypothetical protein